MRVKDKKTKPFDIQKSIHRATTIEPVDHTWRLAYGTSTYEWSNNIERVAIIREGIPFGTLEVLSKQLNKSIKYILELVGLPQTTYNKKKNEGALLDSRHSEWVVFLTELINYGVEVFNKEEEKFQRWLKKPNVSLGGHTPESMLDTLTGIHEVESCLNRLEYGNLA